jgi:hypothetical protein
VYEVKVSTSIHTGLSNGDEIVSSEHSRNTVALNGSRILVLAEFDVLQHDRMEASLVELLKMSVSEVLEMLM